jgi:hypothetical protein
LEGGDAVTYVKYILYGELSMGNTTSPVFQQYIKPIVSFLDDNSHSRSCQAISDRDWTLMGISRTISSETSGRGFLQDLYFSKDKNVSVSLFFESLKSKRRLSFLKEVCERLVKSDIANEHMMDPFSECDDLKDYDVYAGDGHYHESAIHDERVDGTKYATQHFYLINLRNQMMSHLDLAEYGNKRKREHDSHMLRRQDIEVLRQGAPKGRKVLYVWDRAGLDMMAWRKRKMQGGVYFLTREKKLNRLMVIGEPQFDKNDPVNFGVVNDEAVAPSNGEAIRWVTYQDPASQEVYTYLTNLPFKIRPGVVAFLYKTRWDIEKAYNTFKNKLLEKRAWATSKTAKTIQAHFLCLVWNLSQIMNRKITKEQESKGETHNAGHLARKTDRCLKMAEKAISQGLQMSSLLLGRLRLVEIPVKFYRWLRRYLENEAPWEQALVALQASKA